MIDDEIDVGVKVTVDEMGIEVWTLNGIAHRVDGPALTYPDKLKTEWYLHGQRHRIDGPAYVNLETGFHSWWQCGERHRVDGPAIIYANGNMEYWVDGILIRGPEHFKSLTGSSDQDILMMVLKYGELPWENIE